MEGLTIIIVLAGIGYSALLLVIGSKVIEDFFLSPSAKKWLIVLMIVLPIVGPIIAKSKTQPSESTKKTNQNSDTMSTTNNSYSDSGGCGGGSD